MKLWTPNEDEHLLSMHRRKSSCETMAGRFNTSQEEIIARLAHLSKTPPPDRSEQPKDITPKELVAPAEEPLRAPTPVVGQFEGEVDPLAVVINGIIAHNNSAAACINDLVRIAKTRVAREEIVPIVTQIEALYKQLKGPKAPIAVFVAMVLFDNYLIIPKPKMVDNNAQQSNPPSK